MNHPMKFVALAALSVAIFGCASSKAHFKRAQEATASQRWLEAEQSFDEALRSEPGNKTYQAEYEKMKMEAKKDLKKFLEDDPKSLPMARLMKVKSDVAIKLFWGDAYFEKRHAAILAAESKFSFKLGQEIKKARNKVAGKDYDGALKILDKAESMDPSDKEIAELKTEIDRLRSGKK